MRRLKELSRAIERGVLSRFELAIVRIDVAATPTGSLVCGNAPSCCDVLHHPSTRFRKRTVGMLIPAFGMRSRLAGERRAILLHTRELTVRALAVLFGDLKKVRSKEGGCRAVCKGIIFRGDLPISLRPLHGVVHRLLLHMPRERKVQPGEMFGYRGDPARQKKGGGWASGSRPSQMVAQRNRSAGPSRRLGALFNSSCLSHFRAGRAVESGVAGAPQRSAAPQC